MGRKYQYFSFGEKSTFSEPSGLSREDEQVTHPIMPQFSRHIGDSDVITAQTEDDVALKQKGFLF